MQPALMLVDNQRHAVAESSVSHFGMTEKQWAQYDAVVSLELAKLRAVYPTQARSFSDDEYNTMTAVWLEAFADVDPQALHEAIMRFIKADRKAFFPSPGQIMGHVEEIEKERRELEWQRKSIERMMRYREKLGLEDGNHDNDT